MMIGDLTTYSIAGGVSSGESVGGTIGNLIGWGASKLLFVILSPIILSAVAIAFSYPALFEKNKPKDSRKQVSKPLNPPATAPSQTLKSSPKPSTVLQSPIPNVEAKTETPTLKPTDRNDKGSRRCRCISLRKLIPNTFICRKRRSNSSLLNQVSSVPQSQ